MSVRLAYEVRYSECDLAPKWSEQKPVLELFFDAHFVRSRASGGVADFALDEDNLGTVYKGQLTAAVSRRVREIPPTACIGLASFALKRNQFGHYCYVDVGTSHAFVGKILDECRTRGYYEHEHALQMHTTHPLGERGESFIKGKVVLRITQLDMGVARLVRGPTPLSEPADGLIMDYVQRTMRMEMQYKDTIPGTERIRAPMDISESGIELTGDMFLPVAAYAMFEVPRSNATYWRNAFSRVMQRHGMRRSDYHGLDRAQKARFMALIMCYQAQTYDYIGDEIDRNTRHAKYMQQLKQGYENFGDATVTTSGDCEDSATVIQQVFSAFRDFKFPENELELLEMQQLAKQYVPFLTLAVVHGQKAGDDENEPKGAHMYVTMLTRYQFERALGKTPEGRRLLENLPWDAGEPVDESLPTLFGEGTGMIDTLGYHDEQLEARKYVMLNARSMAPFKKELPHERGAPSNFYLGNLLGITNEFFQYGGNVGGFVFGTTVEGRPDEMTRGTYWVDVINQSETMAIVPHPRIPSKLMATMREATALRVPPRALTITQPPRTEHKQDKLLDALVDTVASYGRRSDVQHSIDVYMRPHQFDADTIEAISKDLWRLKRVVRVDYELEQVTDLVYQYRLMLFVAPEK